MNNPTALFYHNYSLSFSRCSKSLIPSHVYTTPTIFDTYQLLQLRLTEKAFILRIITLTGRQKQEK